MIRQLITTTVLCLSLTLNAQVESMKSGFFDPPKDARPHVWWHWMNGNISLEGIRKDLLWMHNVGVGGVHIFDAGLNTPQIVPKRIAYMTPEWGQCLREAVGLAHSLGMDVVLPSAPGWSNTGGPWVKPDDAMKRIEWRDTVVVGGRCIDMALPSPYTTSGYYQNYIDKGGHQWPTPYYKDICLLAVRLDEPEPTMVEMVKHIRCSHSLPSPASLYDGNLNVGQRLAPKAKGDTAWIEVELHDRRLIRSLSLADGLVLGSWAIYPDKPAKYLDASDDGRHWWRICQIPNCAAPMLTLSIPPTRARFFRLVYAASALPVSVAEFRLSTAARVNHVEEKAGFGGPLRLIDYPTPTTSAPSAAEVIDLTAHTTPEGHLRWQAPTGIWRIYRFGYSLTGKENHPASPEATGLEVDKLDSTAVRHYLEVYLDTYRHVLGDSAIGKAINGLLVDSYEAGFATWTRQMRREFWHRRGYDLLPWLPVLAGEIIESASASDRFLDDYRLTLSELITQNLYGQVHRVAREQGLTTYFEAMETARPFVADGIAPKAQADIPMAAQWARTQTLAFTQKAFLEMQADMQESASAAHLYGKPIVAAESFTAYGPSQGDSLVYALYPARLKRVADLEFACGINRIVIHESAHQPVDSLLPGLSLDKYGMWFNRLNTWAPHARGWLDYMARSCYLLQQGTNVADIAYFYGDEANATALFDAQKPPIPSGFSFDFVHADALSTLLSFDGTHLVTPGGARYKVLVLGGTSSRLTPSTLAHIKRLADQGATIVGCRPTRAMGLPTDTAAFNRMADEVWNTGRKNVIIAHSIDEIADSIGLHPDFFCSHMDSVRFVHRTTAEADIYWVNNRSNRPMHDIFQFRTTGHRPEVWDAVTGQISDVSYSVGTHSTYVEMTLQPAEARFIVFSGKPDASLRHQASQLWPLATDTLSGSWTVEFGGKMGTPQQITMDTLKSYIDSTLIFADSIEAKAVRYFSGTAVYRTKVQLADIHAQQRVLMSLGIANYLAEVWVNGIDCESSWNEPHVVDITHAAKEGINAVEIRITNPWKNRLCGDKMAVEGEKKYTWTSYPWSKKTKNTLMPAGLLGPVTITRYQ